MYACEGMSLHAMTILGIVVYADYYTRHLPGDDQDYRKEDDEVDAHIHKNMYVYKISIKNAKNEIRPHVGCYTSYVSLDKRGNNKNLMCMNPNM